jgi:hypothetical protein
LAQQNDETTLAPTNSCPREDCGYRVLLYRELAGTRGYKPRQAQFEKPPPEIAKANAN